MHQQAERRQFGQSEETRTWCPCSHNQRCVTPAVLPIVPTVATCCGAVSPQLCDKTCRWLKGTGALGGRELPSCWNYCRCVVGGCASLSQCVPLAGRSVSGREGAKGWFTKRRAPTIQKVTSQRPSSRNHHEVWRDENSLRRAAPASASGGQHVVISRWSMSRSSVTAGGGAVCSPVPSYRYPQHVGAQVLSAAC